MKLEEIWNYKHSEPILGIEFGDINGNNEIEIIAYSKGGKILIFSIRGEKIFEKKITENSAIWHARSFDLDNDGKNELVLGGMDGLLRIFKCTPSYQLDPMWVHQFGGSISGILIADVNNDGIFELIVYSLDKTIRVLNPSNGMLIWGQVFEDGIGDAITWTDNQDLNNIEIIACGNDNTVRDFNGMNGGLMWFKRFTNKIRCINCLNSELSQIILCGGDDKLLYFIDKKNQKEVKTIQFDEYVWKCRSFPSLKKDKALISTYSFEYFNASIPIEKIQFLSKLTCIDENFEVLWEIAGKNIESLNIVEKNESIYISIGTTIGETFVVDAFSGEILYGVMKESCTNMVKILPNKNLIFSCHDDGAIYAFYLKNL